MDFWAGYLSGAAGVLIGNPLGMFIPSNRARVNGYVIIPNRSLTPSPSL